ncbi:MAG: hypothetical protein ACP5K8_08520 [Nitrososphaeria archaeon]
MEISVLDGPFPNSDVNRINIEHPFRIRVDRYVRDTFASIFPASISGVVLDLGVGNMIILEKFSIDSIRKAFAELEEMAPSLELDTVKVEGEDKYVDREYAFEAITSK